VGTQPTSQISAIPANQAALLITLTLGKGFIKRVSR
jgi:hypothetical protein